MKKSDIARLRRTLRELKEEYFGGELQGSGKSLLERGVALRFRPVVSPLEQVRDVAVDALVDRENDDLADVLLDIGRLLESIPQEAIRELVRLPDDIDTLEALDMTQDLKKDFSEISKRIARTAKWVRIY